MRPSGLHRILSQPHNRKVSLRQQINNLRLYPYESTVCFSLQSHNFSIAKANSQPIAIRKDNSPLYSDKNQHHL